MSSTRRCPSQAPTTRRKQLPEPGGPGTSPARLTWQPSRKPKTKEGTIKAGEASQKSPPRRRQQNVKADGFGLDRDAGWFKSVGRKLRDLANIKTREQEWTDGDGMIFGNLLTICRQEETARKSLIQTINRRDRPEGYEEIWEEQLRGCGQWTAQKLFDF
eukprot:4179583-Heterocapsa_arctica.AAC.1